MAEAELAQNADAPSRRSVGSFLRRKLPFIAVLALAVFGVAYQNISSRPLVGYWEFLALATGILCVVTAWDDTEGRSAHYRLIGTQVAHWAAILLAMNMLLWSDLRQMLPAPATSLVLLTLFALGTFLAGVNLMSLEICFLGLAMALAVPAIAWFKQSALFLLLGAVFVMGLLLNFWPRRPSKERTT
jgi:hypothetical protein